MNKIVKKFLAVLILSIILFAQPGFVLATAAGDCAEYCSDPYSETNPTGFTHPPGETCLCSPISATSVEALIEGITNWIFYIAIVLAPLMIIIGAFMFMTSAGDPTKVQTAKKLIIWTVIGFAIILFSKGLISLIRTILGA